MRANEIAAAHIAHGSSVTWRSQSTRRSEPIAAAAARIASISACAVGSRAAIVALRARAITAPPRTITQPIGTSPSAAAVRASTSASSMNDGIARSHLQNLLFRAPRYAMIDRKSEIDAERIAKRIARAGLCSRREAEQWILAGRVEVNGKKIASPALDVRAADRILVDGKSLPERDRTRLFLYHKPRGLVTSA